MKNPKNNKSSIKKFIKVSLIVLLLVLAFAVGYIYPKGTLIAPGSPVHGHLIAQHTPKAIPKTMPKVEVKQKHVSDASVGTIKTPNGDFEVLNLGN